jgi:putative aldouronate transport system substrate-binding protein
MHLADSHSLIPKTPKPSRLQEDVKPEAVLTTVRFAPEKRNFRRLAIMNANAVPVTSETPSAGVQFFNWLYSSQEYYNLLNFGIEGEHWEDIGDRRYRALVEPTEYSFGDWMMGNHTLAKVDEHMPDRNLPFFLGWDEDAVSSVAIGFTFDPEPVSAEWTACKAEIEATVYPLKFGVISYDEGFEDMRAKMDAAGYERVVEEWNKQFQAWLATR